MLDPLEALESVEHLGEISRLFFVLRRHNRSRMEQQALVTKCKATAGLSTQYPRPKPALALAIGAGLMRTDGKEIAVTPRGRLFVSVGDVSTLRISEAQGKLLLASFLDDPMIEIALKMLLTNFQMVRGRLVARKSSLSTSLPQTLSCRALQQLGAIVTAGDYYVIQPSFEGLLNGIAIQASRFTQAELLRRLERQRVRADLAEEAVLKLEKRRLVSAKRTDLAAKVERLSLDDVSAGYDIRSFEVDETPRLIEVKSSVGARVSFEWSLGERRKAQLESTAYFIYFVPHSYGLPTLISPLVMIQDPLSLVDAGDLIETASHFSVRERDDYLSRATVSTGITSKRSLLFTSSVFESAAA
jgi:hypothetical protein